MESIYPVLLNDRQAGEIILRKVGLYYDISCSCRLPDQRIYRLYAKCGDNLLRLGIPVPETNTYNLQTRYPAEKLNLSQLQFCLLPIDETLETNLIAVDEDGPFVHISRLDQAKLAIRNGEKFILLAQRNPQASGEEKELSI